MIGWGASRSFFRRLALPRWKPRRLRRRGLEGKAWVLCHQETGGEKEHMKSNQTSAAEIVVQLPSEGEWLALEQSPSTNSSYLRIVARDGTELAYRPILLDTSESWAVLRRAFIIGSGVSHYIEFATSSRFRSLVQSHVHGVTAYDFETGICVLENGTEISIDDCETIRRKLATHIGVEILPVPSGSQSSVDLAFQLLRQYPEVLPLGGDLSRARLNRRLNGLEGRWVTIHFADGSSDSGVVERTRECLPRYSLRNGVHVRIVNPVATILMVDLTGEIDATAQEVV